MVGSIPPNGAVLEGAPLFALAPDDSDDAGPLAPTHPPAPAGAVHADVGRALVDGLARALAAGNNREARRILSALSALAAEDAPEAPPVRGRPVVVDLVTQGDKRVKRS
jgi:hypothetical protein